MRNSEDRQRQRACATEYLLPLKIGLTETLQKGGAFVIDTGRKTMAGHRRRMAVPERLLSATKRGPARRVNGVWPPPASWPGGRACAATLTLEGVLALAPRGGYWLLLT